MPSPNDLKAAAEILGSVPPALFGAEYGIRMQPVRYKICEPVEVPIKVYKHWVGEEKQIVHLLDDEGHFKITVLKPGGEAVSFYV